MAGNTDDGAAINVIEQTENELLDKFSKMKVVDLRKYLKICGVHGVQICEERPS